MIGEERLLEPKMTIVLTPRQSINKYFRRDIFILRSEDISSLELSTTQSFISSSARYISKFVSTILYSKHTKDDCEKKSELLFLKINNFFSYICEYVQMTGSELVYAIYLIQKLVESEIQDLDQDKQSAMITESNIGTVLICAVILAMKVLRDVIEKNNSWWAKAFEMSLQLLNHSELAFYIQLDFNITISYQQFISKYHEIFSRSDD